MPVSLLNHYTPSLCALAVVAYAFSAIAQITKIVLKLGISILTASQLFRTKRLKSWSFSGLGKDLLMLNTLFRKIQRHAILFF